MSLEILERYVWELSGPVKVLKRSGQVLIRPHTDLMERFKISTRENCPWLDGIVREIEQSQGGCTRELFTFKIEIGTKKQRNDRRTGDTPHRRIKDIFIISVIEDGLGGWQGERDESLMAGPTSRSVTSASSKSLLSLAVCNFEIALSIRKSAMAVEASHRCWRCSMARVRPAPQ